MVYAYIRVSTELQSYESQRYEIERWCKQKRIVPEKIIEETASGAVSFEKRRLGKAIKKMRGGDIIVCCELSRLGRNMMMVMAILNKCSQKGIHLYSIKDGFELSDSLNSKIIAFAFSLAAEIERNLISQRTREALAAKKASGVKLGRPCGTSKKKNTFCERKEEILHKRESGASIKVLAKELKVHPNTLSRYIKDSVL